MNDEMARTTFLALLVFALALPALVAVGCAHNVNDALAEIKYGDPVSVRQAINEVGELLVRKERAGYPLDEADREAVSLLQDLAGENPDSIIRSTAISTLARLKTQDSTDVYIVALEDDSAAWIVRHEAAKALRVHPTPRASGPLIRRLEAETTTDVLLAVIPALQAVGGDDALEAVLTVFLDQSTRYRALKDVAYEAARALSGKTFSILDRPAWKAYSETRFPEKEGESSEGGES